jgi:two-component SAPR family response regulator
MINVQPPKSASQSLQTVNFGPKVTLLSPLSSQNIESFLGNVVRGPGESILTFASPPRQTTIHQWIGELCSQLRKMSPNLGLETIEALDAGKTPRELGAVLAQELNGYTRKPVILFIDTFNRADIDDGFETFFTALVEGLGDDVRVAINSIAGIPPFTLYTAPERSETPSTAADRNLQAMMSVSTARPQLRVTAFGKGTASVNGREIAHWDGQLPKTLFFYFVDRTLLTRDQIFADFWPQPQVTIKDATDIFHVTKHKVSEILNKTYASNDDEIELTRYKQGLYIPGNRLDRSYDVADFENSLLCAERCEDDTEREGFLRHAIDLYKAPYLTSLDTKWVVRRRAELAHRFSEALIALGRLLMRKGAHADALALFEQALTYRPEREDIRRLHIDLLAEAGARDRAVEAARALELDVYRRLGMKIPAETLELFRRHNIHI